MSKPEPFIETQNDGSFTINPKVVKILQSVDKPVSVIAIAGKYRTGKSYLMNRLYGKNSGFPLGGSIQSKTKGIWLWAKPHPEDRNKCLILLDTEGLYDVDKGDETHDLKIFSLALLLSSCFVFNLVGAIDDGAIQQLHLVSELTNHITTGTSEEMDGETGQDFSSYFPHFVLVVRDFFLSLEINGRCCTSDEYLEHALRLKPGVSERVKSYNKPRECLREYFPHRNCYTLPRPVDSDLQLKTMERVAMSDIRPEFLHLAENAVGGIIEAAREFKINNNTITGKRFVALAQMYVGAMNSGRVPNIESSVEMLKNNECQQALEESIRHYTSQVQAHVVPRLPIMVDEVSQWHKQISDGALTVYKQRALFDDDGVYVNKFMADIQQEYERLTLKNEEESKKKCQLLIQQHFNSLEENVKSNRYTSKSGGYQSYLQDKKNAIQRYENSNNKGPLGSSILEEYLKVKETEEQSIMNADKALSEAEKRLAEEKLHREREEHAAKVMADKNHALKRKLVDEQEHNKQVIKKTREDFEAKIAAEQKQQNLLIQKKEQELKRLKDEGSEKAAEFERHLQELKNQNQDLLASSSQMKSQMSDVESRYNSLLNELNNDRNASAAKIQALQNQLAELQRRHQPPPPSGGRRKKKKCVIM